jgi:hypothetical protein
MVYMALSSPPATEETVAMGSEFESRQGGSFKKRMKNYHTKFCLSETQPMNAIVNPPHTHTNLEIIASKQACFIKQTNIFI